MQTHPALAELMQIAEDDPVLKEKLKNWLLRWVLTSNVETFEPQGLLDDVPWEEIAIDNAKTAVGRQACEDGLYSKPSEPPWDFAGRQSKGRRFMLTFLRVPKDSSA